MGIVIHGAAAQSLIQAKVKLPTNGGWNPGIKEAINQAIWIQQLYMLTNKLTAELSFLMCNCYIFCRIRPVR